MKVALINPPWSYDGSIYFGCREPHLPTEYGCAQALLEADGHQVALIDAHLEGLSRAQLRARVEAFAPEMTVVTTAPTYLFWRCPPPELRVPGETLRDLEDVAGHTVLVGPHASTSPVSTMNKLPVEAAVLGECEEVLQAMAREGRGRWGELPSVATRDAGRVRVNGRPHTTDLLAVPALRWSDALVSRHHHHHHRFDGQSSRVGAEIEWSRGCPYRCTFCAKETHRDKYRKRALDTVLAELDGLISQGVEYVYFIDEIFLPDRALLEALRGRAITFGVQTRIDLWSFELIDLLGDAGCVTIEAGVESITPEGRAYLDKRCKLQNEELTARLARAKKKVPFVQATLMDSHMDDPAAVAAWRSELAAHGVWANEPVPLFPYPGSPDYRRLFGEPDEQAWERAHDYYLGKYERYSDIQDRKFVRLPVLESAGA